MLLIHHENFVIVVSMHVKANSALSQILLTYIDSVLPGWLRLYAYNI